MEFTGERQIGERIEQIRADHVARYEFAASRLVGKRVLDCGSGVGYGASILGNRAARVVALERDAEACAYARQHYNSVEHVEFIEHDITRPYEDAKGFDAAVAFELLEHLEDPAPFLRKIQAPLLFVSVPNQLVIPWHEGYAYHHRHYTPAELEQLLNECGYDVREWYGQREKFDRLEPNIQGRTLVAVAEQSKAPRGGMASILPEVKPSLGSVAIVAMGDSNRAFFSRAAPLGGAHRVADHVWAINGMGGIMLHDLLFHMDDLRLQELRAEAQPDGVVGGMLHWLKAHPRFYTSKVYHDYPGAMEYPIERVSREFACNLYFNSTLAYAVALAIVDNARKIMLYGCDFSYPNMHQREKGRACVEFLLGIAVGKGIEIEVPRDTSLLDASAPHEEFLYGYDAEYVHWVDGALVREPKDLPSVDEIERRYDKRAPA